MSITYEVYSNGQRVNATNMRNTVMNPITILDAYYPLYPSIPSGIGTISNNFGQVGTSNVFVFSSGWFRFNDQLPPLGSNINAIYSNYSGTTVTVTCPISTTQYYIVALLSLVISNPNEYTTSSTISQTALTLSDISLNPSAYLIICAITNTGGIYTVSLDSNCAFNYGYNSSIFPDIIDNTLTNTVSIIGAGGLNVLNKFISPDIIDIGGNVLIGNSIYNYTTRSFSLDLNNYMAVNETGVFVSGPTTKAIVRNIIYEADHATGNTGIISSYGVAPYVIGNFAILDRSNPHTVAVLNDIPAVPFIPVVSSVSYNDLNQLLIALITTRSDGLKNVTINGFVRFSSMISALIGLNTFGLSISQTDIATPATIFNLNATAEAHVSFNSYVIILQANHIVSGNVYFTISFVSS